MFLCGGNDIINKNRSAAVLYAKEDPAAGPTSRAVIFAAAEGGDKAMEQKTVVITGASSGIGNATAALFAENGFRVYDLSRSGGSTQTVTHIRADVTKPETLREAMAAVVNETGRLDVLVCCAGMGVSGPVEFIPEADMKRQFEVNLYGTVNTVQAALPFMREARAGRILCVSSVAAVYAIPFQAYYSASKAAINAFVSALRNEVKPFGVTVTAVMPGDISTGFTAARQKTVLGEDVYPHARTSVQKMEKDEIYGMPPAAAAKLIYKLANKKAPAPLYTVGLSYKALVFLNRLFPASLANKIVGGMYK